MKILDCTLRDGGYYTNWDFDQSLVSTYLEAFNHLPVEYLEVGYRSIPLSGYFGEYFYCTKDTLAKLQRLSNKKLAIILNEKDIRAEHVPELLAPCQGIIRMIRMAVDPKNFLRAIELAKAVKAMGFEVAFNVMYMSNWKKDTSFMEQIGLVNGLADYFYLVDSFGGVYPEDVTELVGMVKSKVTCKIGFHGHNNLELGLVNTLTAVEAGADIVDATITGMGRGAGNLKTELLFTALNAKYNLEVDFNKLSAVVDVFEELKRTHEWGTNLPYMVSGANSIPQKEVMEWVTKRFYSLNSIIRALDNRKSGKKDNVAVDQFQPENKKSKTVLLLGGGPSAAQHKRHVHQFAEIFDDLAIVHASSKNASYFLDIDVPQYFCLVGNEGHRLEKNFEEISEFKGICVLPPYPRKMGTYIPEQVKNGAFELEKVTFSDLIEDSHTALALQTIIELGATEIYALGYDGYLEGTVGANEIGLMQENDRLFQDFKHFTGKTPISLIPTQYKNLETKSLYAIISDNE